MSRNNVVILGNGFDISLGLKTSYADFIKFIDNGNIVITFKIGVFKNGERKGQIHDRGTDFSIYLCDIDKLYEPVFITDGDLGQEVKKKQLLTSYFNY